MASCYWAQPAHLHPWYKPATLKRKLPTMLPCSEPFPADEYDSDSRAKRQCRITLDQTRSKKRSLPSPPLSPINNSNDQRLPKRQRCTTLERGIEGLSLAPRAPVGSQTPELAARQPAIAPASVVLAHPPDVSSQWPEMSSPMPGSYQIPSPSPPSLTSIPFTSAPACIQPTPALIVEPHGVRDVKMRTTSWYEPEKDRACFIYTLVVVGGGGSALKLSLTNLIRALATCLQGSLLPTWTCHLTMRLMLWMTHQSCRAPYWRHCCVVQNATPHRFRDYASCHRSSCNCWILRRHLVR